MLTGNFGERSPRSRDLACQHSLVLRSSCTKAAWGTVGFASPEGPGGP